MDCKFIIVIPPFGGIIVEKIENYDELNSLIEKYCGFNRIFVDTPLGLDYMVYASPREKDFLPVNLALSWIVGGGKSKDVFECYYGYGVICRYVPGNSTFEDAVTGFKSLELHNAMRKIRALIPGRNYS